MAVFDKTLMGDGNNIVELELIGEGESYIQTSGGATAYNKPRVVRCRRWSVKILTSEHNTNENFRGNTECKDSLMYEERIACQGIAGHQGVNSSTFGCAYAGFMTQYQCKQ